MGSEEYRQEYCGKMVENWTEQLTTLCGIAVTQPQAAYSAYVRGYRSKFTFFFRTIENFDQFIEPIDNLIADKFLPALFGLDEVPANFRGLFSLGIKEGGLGIGCLGEEAKEQYEYSRFITRPHVESIIEQRNIMKSTDNEGKSMVELKSSCLLKKTSEGRKEWNPLTLNCQAR